MFFSSKINALLVFTEVDFQIDSTASNLVSEPADSEILFEEEVMEIVFLGIKFLLKRIVTTLY